MKDLIRVDEAVGPRFELALDQLESRSGFEFHGVWFRIDAGRLSCEAVSPVSSPSLTETAAIELIEHARSLCDNLQAVSDRFNSLTRDLPRRFCVIEDYGTGTALIAELFENKLVWSR
jgi:hypothetical protein